jgi:outer membrane protein TolC
LQTAREPSSAQLDFWSALELGGANSLLIELARQQVELAEQQTVEAQALWYPSLRMGLGYSRHDGQLQSTSGEVIQAGRNSFFFGGGAGLGSVPLPGGAGGPPRMFVNLSLADARFEPVIAERRLEASRSAQSSVMNDVLLEIAVAYLDVLQARSRLVNARQSHQDATGLLELARLFAREGKGSEAEVNRAQVERAQMQIELEESQRQIIVRTARLCQKLHLPPDTQLVPEEEQLRPMQVIEDQQGHSALIAHGLARRPELAEQNSLIEAARGELTREQWRPWLPNLQVGASGGTFGGGGSGSF